MGGKNIPPLFSFSDEKNRSAFMGAQAPAGLRQRAEMRAGARKKPPMEPRAHRHTRTHTLTYKEEE